MVLAQVRVQGLFYDVGLGLGNYTTSARDALGSVPAGLMIYNTDDNAIQVQTAEPEGTTWVSVGTVGNFGLAAGTQTGSTGTILFSNSNGISFGMSGSSRITASHNALTAGVQSLSGGTTRVTSGEVVFSNSNGVSFGVDGQTVTASVAAGGGGGAAISAGTQSVSTGTVVFSNSNGLTFGMSGSSRVTGSFDGIRSISAGTTRALGPEIILSNSNGVSFGANGSTITASHNALTAGIQSVSAGTTRATSGELVFSNSNGVTFGINGQTLTASAAGGGGGGATISKWPFLNGATVLSAPIYTGASAATGGSTQWTASGHVFSVPFPHDLHFSNINGYFSALATSAGTGSVTDGLMLGIYTLNAGTALSRLSSFQFVMEMSQNSITARSHRWYWGTNSTSNSTSLGGNVSATFSGLRAFPIFASAGTLSASNYYFAAMVSKRTAGVNVYGATSLAYLTTAGASCIGTNVLPRHPWGFIGTFSTSTNTNVITGLQMPGSIHTSALSGNAAANWRFPFFDFYRNT